MRLSVGSPFGSGAGRGAPLPARSIILMMLRASSFETPRTLKSAITNPDLQAARQRCNAGLSYRELSKNSSTLLRFTSCFFLPSCFILELTDDLHR